MHNKTIFEGEMSYSYEETHGDTRRKADPNGEGPSTAAAVSLSWAGDTQVFIVIFTTFCVGKTVINLKSEKAQNEDNSPQNFTTK